MVSPLYPFKGHFLDRPGGRLHFLDEGTGEPVVMLHGNPTWSFYYRNLVRALRDGYRCVAPDPCPSQAPDCSCGGDLCTLDFFKCVGASGPMLICSDGTK